ncbi:hypothetical protein E5F05_10690 [Deinococcus metallilatus]|uniref:Uncharacterized protein n=1 Tax=Deinococcus metallilatus TaxID=1211322 RepID=A0AAJ5JZB6_9DEIO|nr:hypothetical protein [Deinococcus metallilatus]MBB5296619.1 hypothetical protein [Deinococcus metallilatus]QBY08362.1 hypothetical protein E5F05_10690 [Deinococcus metallilatus]RXJ11161.1 hypothetical protein ERJ73_09510 [Deinococcus metallilatus]TLK24652.1 hypothetical protein FCS05_13945 [Deinococcus metallilatus]
MTTHVRWRAAFLTALTNFKVSRAGMCAYDLRATLTLLPARFQQDDDLDAEHDEVPEGAEDVTTVVVRALAESAAFVMEWVDALQKADPTATARLHAAHARAYAAAEELDGCPFPLFRDTARCAFQAIENVQKLKDVPEAVHALQAVPIPHYRPGPARRPAPWPSRSATTHTPVGPYVVKALFDVDQRPWNSPHVFQKEVVYAVHARLTVPDWPAGARCLRLEHVTTLAPEQYHLHLPPMERPPSGQAAEAQLTGSVTFMYAQSMASEPLVLRLRATFEHDEPSVVTPATIVGYHELHAHVLDERLAPLYSRYRSVDRRMMDIMGQVQSELPKVDLAHQRDFAEILGAVCNFQSLNLQQGLYDDKRGQTVTEAEFQETLLNHLRMLLGEDVKEAPWQGNGETDIQYRSITVELKVEKSVKDRRKLVERFVRQPTQYTSAGGGQLGVLCILDLTEKKTPPANAMSNLTLEAPVLHGFEDQPAAFPTRIAVVFVDGNLRLPSSYSR